MTYTTDFFKQLPQLPFDITEGQRLQRKGQETVAAKNEQWLVEMRLYARALSETLGRVTSDDVRFHATGLGQYPTHHNCWGGVFRCPGWVCIGREPSKVPSNHARWINVYRWVGLDTPAQKDA